VPSNTNKAPPIPSFANHDNRWTPCDGLHVSYGSTPVIEDSEANFRFGWIVLKKCEFESK
jgi:hypothetical protein